MITENMATLDDKTLIQLTLAGHTECFSVLMDRHAIAARKFIRLRVKQTPDIEDLLQNTFLKAWVRLSSFRFEASFRTWLLRVALNEVFQHYRYHRCRPWCAQTVDIQKLVSAADSPEQLLERSEVARAVRLAITGLPDKYQETATLCEIQQLTAIETARYLKSTVALVKTRRFRARNMLSAALKNKRPVSSAVDKAA